MSVHATSRADALIGRGIESAVGRVARKPGRWAFYILLITVVLGGGLFSVVEPDADWFDGVWWATVTLTTVGYGDFSPESFLGRWVGAGVMFGGIASVAILTGLLAGEIAKRRMAPHSETPELDDDIEEMKAAICDRLDNFKAITSHPRVVQALREIHHERTRGAA